MVCWSRPVMRAVCECSYVECIACCARCRYVEHREVMVKLLCFLYTVFNALVAFPRVLTAIQPGGGLCNVAWVLRYCNAQPLLTSNVVSMVCLHRISLSHKSLSRCTALFAFESHASPWSGVESGKEGWRMPSIACFCNGSMQA